MCAIPASLRRVKNRMFYNSQSFGWNAYTETEWNERKKKWSREEHVKYKAKRANKFKSNELNMQLVL